MDFLGIGSIVIWSFLIVLGFTLWDLISAVFDNFIEKHFQRPATKETESKLGSWK